MVTPSLDLQYWIWGTSIKLASPQKPAAAPPPLQRLLAAVLERDSARPRQRADSVRHQHFTRGREPADARGDVHGAAVDVVVLADYVAGVEAQMQRHSGGCPRLPAGQRRLDRLPRTREDGEDAVAEELAFDRNAAVVADDGAESSVQIARLRAEGGVAEALGERGGVGDVGEEDGQHP